VTWLPTFEDCPRYWVIFDVDRISVPDQMANDWVDDPEAAVEHVLGALPAQFRSASCWWSLSSSAAVPGPNGREVANEFKIKLAFWLERRLTGAEVKRWMAAEKAYVDPAVLGAVQLIYLARPGFGPGLQDPVPRRIGTWQGEVDVVAVPELLPEPPSARYTNEAAAFGPAEGLNELCAALRARLEGELHVREHLLQAARAYLRQHGLDIDRALLVASLEGVALERRSRAEVAGYDIARLVDYVVQEERVATWIPFGRPAPQAMLPPYFGTECTNMFAVISDQRRFLRSWLDRNHLFAMARREIAARRKAAFAAEGLA
jgi:hypothetical protein